MTLPTDNKIITTDLFTVKPGTYLRCLASRWLDIYGLRIGIPFLAALFIGGAFDLRIAISIIFLAMVATPMVGLVFLLALRHNSRCGANGHTTEGNNQDRI